MFWKNFLSIKALNSIYGASICCSIWEAQAKLKSLWNLPKIISKSKCMWISLYVCWNSSIENRYEHVFWIDASNRDTFEQSYKNIASKIGTISDKKVSLEEALQELDCYRGKWLLLFDGADSLEDVLDLFPLGTHGDIIYTSRNPMLRRLPASQTRHVAEMGHGEASKLC